MKNLILAIVIAVVLVNGLGTLANDWWGMHLVMADGLLSPFENLMVFSVLAVVFVVVGFIVAVSLAGAIVIGLGAALFSVLVLGVTAFWPLVLIVAVVYLLRQNRRTYTSDHSIHS